MLDGVDRVRDAHRRRAVRHEHHRPPGALGVKRAEDDRLVQAVEVARRLVEQEEGRVVQERAREPQPLPLAAGERVAQLTDLRVIPLRQRRDERVYRRLAAGGGDLLVRRVGTRDMIPQNYVELSADEDITNINRILDLLDDDDDVQQVYHNWDE